MLQPDFSYFLTDTHTQTLYNTVHENYPCATKLVKDIKGMKKLWKYNCVHSLMMSTSRIKLNLRVMVLFQQTIFDNIDWDNLVFTCMHSVVIYHCLIHFFHPPSPHPFQCWRRASRHQIFVGPTLNWGNGGRYPFQIIWNYSSCPMVSDKDCSLLPSSNYFGELICVNILYKVLKNRARSI
jgi:hypothetical protein